MTSQLLMVKEWKHSFLSVSAELFADKRPISMFRRFDKCGGNRHLCLEEKRFNRHLPFLHRLVPIAHDLALIQIIYLSFFYI